MRNRIRHNYPSLIHCLWAFHILFFSYLLFRCYCYNYYKKNTKTFIFTVATITITIIPLLLLNNLLQILSYPGVVELTTQLQILENILWLPLCRIKKFRLNTLPSKTVAIPYTCGLSTTKQLWCSQTFSTFTQYMSVSHGCSTMVEENMVVVEKTKRGR